MMIACLLLPGCASSRRRVAIDDPRWPAAVAGLSGVWRGELGGSVVEEVWLAPRGGNMTGAMRMQEGGGVVQLIELLTLTAADDGVRLRIRHYDEAMTGWTAEADGPLECVLASEGGGRMVFRPVERGGDLETMTYDLSGRDTLVVTLAFRGGREPLVIPFERDG